MNYFYLNFYRIYYLFIYKKIDNIFYKNLGKDNLKYMLFILNICLNILKIIYNIVRLDFGVLNFLDIFI